MQKNEVIIPVEHEAEQFLSSTFISSKEIRLFPSGNKPEKTGLLCRIETFQDGGLFLLNKLLEKDNFLCKQDLKDAYFSLPLYKDSQTYLRFQWVEKLNQSLCLCFGLFSAPRIFRKLMKIPI